MPYPAWSQEQTDELKRLHELHYSAGKIAELIGVSRNSVCGKKWRLGLLGHGNPGGAPTHRNAPRRRSAPKPIDQRLPARPTIKALLHKVTAEAFVMKKDNGGIPFIDRKDGQCSWPLWSDDVKTGNVCGEKVLAENGFIMPYCACHCKLAYGRQEASKYVGVSWWAKTSSAA